MNGGFVPKAVIGTSMDAAEPNKVRFMGYNRRISTRGERQYGPGSVGLG